MKILQHLKEKKKKNYYKQKAKLVSYNILTQMNPLAAAEFDLTSDFAIYLCSQKYNRKIERSKNLPKCFSLMVIFLYSQLKLLFSCRKFCC